MDKWLVRNIWDAGGSGSARFTVTEFEAPLPKQNTALLAVFFALAPLSRTLAERQVSM
jgi:hypothetical protein